MPFQIAFNSLKKTPQIAAFTFEKDAPVMFRFSQSPIQSNPIQSNPISPA
jgi:hypothetical protein